MKRLVVLMIVVSIGLSKTSLAQNETVKWYSIEEAIELNKKDSRKIFIDVYTDWCGWCKKMDNSTFTNPAIAKILNEQYYAVKFNAEQKEDVTFMGQTYKFIPSGRRGYHQLAAVLLNNKLSYPSIAYLNEQNQQITAVPGYQTPEMLEPILMYFAENAHLPQAFDIYQKKYLAKKAISNPNKELKNTANSDHKVSQNQNKNNANKYAFIIGNSNQLESDSSNNTVLNSDTISGEYMAENLGIPKENIVLLKNASYFQFRKSKIRIRKIIKKQKGDSEVLFYFIKRRFSDNTKSKKKI